MKQKSKNIKDQETKITPRVTARVWPQVEAVGCFQLWVIAKVTFKKTRTGPLKTGSSLQLPWNKVSFSYMSRFKSRSAGSGTPQSAVATSASLLFTWGAANRFFHSVCSELTDVVSKLVYVGLQCCVWWSSCLWVWCRCLCDAFTCKKQACY